MIIIVPSMALKMVYIYGMRVFRIVLCTIVKLFHGAIAAHCFEIWKKN